jgi:outer membrane receptor for monomeric catechols
VETPVKVRAFSQHVKTKTKTKTRGTIITAVVMVVASTIGCSGSRAAPAETSQSAQQEKRAMPSTTNADDVRQLAQLAIDLPALEKYYHPEVPGRKPLCVVQNQVIGDTVALTKFGQPVRYVSSAEASAGGSACLEFSAIDVSGDTANVGLSYKVEGIRATARYRKSAGTWRLESHTLSEK